MTPHFVSHADLWVARCYRAIFIIGLAALWEISGRLHWVDTDLVPPLSRIFSMLMRLLNDRHFRADAWITTLECLTAFAVVVPAALITGFILGEFKKINAAIGPVFQLMMTVPKSIFLPVFILLFGIGFAEKIIFACVLSFFIVVPTGIAAVQSVPPALVMMARAFGASRAAIYSRIYLPACMPLILSGLRLGLIFSMHGIIFAEMYASSEGLGRNILTWGESFDMERLFAAVMLVMIVTITINETLSWLEQFARRWSGARIS
jgi:ABC-type nitrate/sulfonate/bicarbonate transport system permease component